MTTTTQKTALFAAALAALALAMCGAGCERSVGSRVRPLLGRGQHAGRTTADLAAAEGER